MVTEKVDLVRSDFVAGDAARRAATSGRSLIGDVICFEVAYDEVVRDTVTGGAQLLVVQTNNATFNEAEARQQLAMVRLRAVEHGRDGADGLHRRRVRRSSTPTARSSMRRGFNAEAVDGARDAHSGQRVRLPRRWATGRSCCWWRGGRGAVARASRRSGGDGHGGSGGRDDEESRSAGDTPEGYPGRGPGAGGHPDLQRGRERPRSSSTGCAGRYPAVDVLIADDNSPDGTGADRRRAGRRRRRRSTCCTGPASRASARRTWPASRWARERGYDAVVEMDADGSHAPEELPRLLDALRDADVVIGSRWVRGGKVVNWPVHRLVLSRGANLYTRLALGMPVRTPPAATGPTGCRSWRRSTSTRCSSQGYCFQVDLAWRAHRNGLPGRRGADHVRRARARREQDELRRSSREALWRVTVWGVQARRDALSRALRGRPGEPDRATRP